MVLRTAGESGWVDTAQRRPDRSRARRLGTRRSRSHRIERSAVSAQDLAPDTTKGRGRAETVTTDAVFGSWRRVMRENPSFSEVERAKAGDLGSDTVRRWYSLGPRRMERQLRRSTGTRRVTETMG